MSDNVSSEDDFVPPRVTKRLVLTRAACSPPLTMSLNPEGRNLTTYSFPRRPSYHTTLSKMQHCSTSGPNDRQHCVSYSIGGYSHLLPRSSSFIQLDDGFPVSFSSIPPAKTYPKQNFWTLIDRSFHTPDHPTLDYFPTLSNVELDEEFIGDTYDLTFIAPLDSPEIAASEDTILAQLSSLNTSPKVIRKILRDIDRLRNGKHDEYTLYRRALDNISSELSLPQLELLKSLARRLANVRDSPCRLLLLFLTAFSDKSHPRSQDPDVTGKCTCSRKDQPAFSSWLWSKVEFQALDAALQIHGVDCCRLAKALLSKSCDMVCPP